jgi:hypothetical protein
MAREFIGIDSKQAEREKGGEKNGKGFHVASMHPDEHSILQIVD